MKIFQLIRKIYFGKYQNKEDKICPFGMAKIMNKNIKHSILYPFEKAGHGAFYEVKDNLNKTLIQFLNHDTRIF